MNRLSDEPHVFRLTMLATLGSSWRRGSKALEPISSFRLLTASILQQPSATLNFGTGFTSFFCIKVPETPIERVRQRHVEGGTDSVMKDSVPELKEASSKVKIALEHLKKPNTSQTFCKSLQHCSCFIDCFPYL